MIARTLASQLVSVYSDDRERHCLGHVLARGKLGFEAFDADDKSIGIYPTQGEAADALLVDDNSVALPGEP
jgi:hypothetical protein